jgi:hypothetical protein
MAVLQTCTPANVYGPLQQTLFLGMSVRDFTASAGWNEQFTTLTVNLVTDNCSGVREYFNEEYTWTSGTFNDGDPGFNYAPVGSPAIFKIGETKDGDNIISPGFEFAGLIQSYNVQDSDQGNDLLTVNLIAPGLVLEGAQVVVEKFADETEGVRNLINAYGFLESASCVECPDFPGEGDDDPIQTEDGFGSPAGGFGNASSTSRGTPWIYLKQAIQTLLGGKYTPTDKRFGPEDGVIEYIAGTGTYGSIKNNKYILDIEELPGDPDAPGGPTPGGGNDNEAANANTKEYRINGPVVSILDIISNVCEDGGFDYYVDLLPTKSPGLTIADEGGMVNVIKIRTISRRNTATNEALSGIYDFINSPQITGTVLNSSLGQELVSENTAAFIIGGQRQSMYQTFAFDGFNPLGNTRFWGGNYPIEPFFGYQEPLDGATDNNFNNKKEPIQVLWGEDAPNLTTCPVPPINYYRQWFFYPKLGRLNLIIPAFPDEEELLPCPETMMCAALGDFESWVNWLFKFGNRSLLYTRYNSYVFETYGTTLPTIRPSAAQLNKPPTDDLTLKYPAANNGNPNEALLKDLKTIYEYLNNLGQNYYGKSFLIEVPFVCYSIDDDTKEIVYSDVPATDGGWVDPPYQDCVQSNRCDFF